MKNDNKKRLKLAKQHLNKSVVCINENISSFKDVKTLGVKNTNILKPTVKYMEKFGYILHTIDKKSELNRAVDYELVNPLTFKYMSGSSSGTAYNVFKEINEIGIGSDGGGSVLAPAINLNLYSFISQKLPIVKVSKKSTDDIEFTVSAGLICKDIKILNKIYSDLYIQKKCETKIVYFKTIDDPTLNFVDYIIEYERNNTRKELINHVRKYYEDYIIINYEHEIDVNGYGESLIGSLNEQMQESGNKGLIKVINMLNADAFTIPVQNCSSAFVISTTKFQNELIDVIKLFPIYENKLIDKYYNINTYIDDEYKLED